MTFDFTWLRNNALFSCAICGEERTFTYDMLRVLGHAPAASLGCKPDKLVCEDCYEDRRLLDADPKWFDLEKFDPFDITLVLSADLFCETGNIVLVVEDYLDNKGQRWDRCVIPVGVRFGVSDRWPVAPTWYLEAFCLSEGKTLRLRLDQIQGLRAMKPGETPRKTTT